MTRFRLAVVLFSITATAAPAAAQLEVSKDKEHPLLTNIAELGAYFGGFIANDSHEFYEFGKAEREKLKPLSFAVGFRAGYYPLRYAGIEVEGGWEPTSTRMGHGASLFGLSFHFLGQFPLREVKVTPFFVAGLGTMAVVSSKNALGDDADLISYLGAGAKYTLHPWLTLRADARLIAAPRANSISGTTTHGELLLGASYAFDFTPTPKAPPPAPIVQREPAVDPDPDGDGFIAPREKCPNEAGVAPDGCPAPPAPGDQDGDGIADNEDRCPADAETKNGFEDEDGCPDDVPDSDGDGIADDKDQCKDQPEDADSFEDEDGCPDGDNDGDGLVDASDDCPLEKGPAENRGCPDKDGDGDGVVDRLDNCPTEAGSADNHGCKKKQLAVIKETKIELLDKVYFRTGSARIRRRSYPLLDNIAELINSHPKVKTIRIEGYTDDRGGDGYNQKLSERRAKAVMKYLIRHEVAKERLSAVGLGEKDPIADNHTRQGRRANRRVEFKIVKDQAGAEEK